MNDQGLPPAALPHPPDQHSAVHASSITPAGAVEPGAHPTR